MKLLIGISHTYPIGNSMPTFTSTDLRCRVPQASILGPLLFRLYINDMSQVADCHLFLYADDTRLLFQHKDLERIKEELT